jgi:hypothetical protein
LHHYARFHQDVKFYARHVAGHLVAVAFLSLEDNGDIGIAVGLMITPRTTAE